MLPPISYLVVKREHEHKLREAARIHSLTQPAGHSRPRSLLRSLQNLLTRS